MYLQLTSTDIIGIFTGLATSGAAIATYLTVREIKKQRESSYLPDLCIDTFSARIYGQISTKDIIASKFKSINNFTGEENDSELPNVLLNFKIQNVGLGAAKNICFLWEFDFIGASDIVKNVNGYDGQLADYNIKYGEIELGWHELSSVAPRVNSNLSIPRIVWLLYLYYFALQYSIKNKNGISYFSDEFDSLPKPKLKLTYTDIQNKKYMKTFIFSFTIVGAQKPEGDSLAMLLIEAKELNG